MRYLFRAVFTNGEEFRQPADDCSTRVEGKSAMYDFLGMAAELQIEKFQIIGQGHRYEVDHVRRRFLVDGREVKVGELLPDNCRWTEGDPAQGCYFRRVTKTFNADYEELDTQVEFCLGLSPIPGVANYLGVV